MDTQGGLYLVPHPGEAKGHLALGRYPNLDAVSVTVGLAAELVLVVHADPTDGNSRQAERRLEFLINRACQGEGRARVGT